MLISVFNNEYRYITIKDGDFLVTFCSLGASIYEIKYGSDCLTLTPSYKSDFEKPNYYNNKVIGRTCNRLKDNKIEIDGNTYFLKNNEGDNVLHGGLEALSTKVYDSEILEEKNQTRVIFSCISKDGESGYPGNLSVKITYIIVKGKNTIKCMMEASTDKATYCSLTNHMAFTLGDKNIDGLSLLVPSHTYLFSNSDDLLPIKKENIPPELDFNKSHLIVQSINHASINKNRLKGYDHFYYLDKKGKPIKLANKKYSVEITSNFEGVQIYTDNWEDDIKFENADRTMRRGVAIETQDSHLNHDILDVNKVYDRFIIYKFKKRWRLLK